MEKKKEHPGQDRKAKSITLNKENHDETAETQEVQEGLKADYKALRWRKLSERC